MMGRNCHKCKEPLGEYDYFFCSTCGTKLQKENIREPHAIKVRTYLMFQDSDKLSPSSFFKIFANRNILSILGLAFFIVIVVVGISSTGIFELLTTSLFKSQRIPTVIIPTKEDPVLSLGTNYETGTFNTPSLANLVPGNADFYVEGFDIERFSGYMNTDEDLAPLFTKSSILLENNVVGYFTRDPSEMWVYILVPTDTDLVEKVLEDVNDDYWNFGIIEGYLIMASNENAFVQTDRIISKIEPSLALNSDFVRITQELPTQGQVRVVFMDEEMREILINSLGGLDQTVINNINQVILSNFNGVVIK